MLNTRDLISSISKKLNVSETEALKEGIKVINKKEAMYISMLAVNIWHETSCSTEEAIFMAKDLYREGYRYEML